MFRIHGLEPKEKAPSIPEYIELVHPEDRDFVAQEIRKMLRHLNAFGLPTNHEGVVTFDLEHDGRE